MENLLFKMRQEMPPIVWRKYDIPSHISAFDVLVPFYRWKNDNPLLSIYLNRKFFEENSNYCKQNLQMQERSIDEEDIGENNINWEIRKKKKKSLILEAISFG